MNKTRRTALAKILKRIEALDLDTIMTDLDSISAELQDIHGDEQGALENMSEGLQGGERGQAMQAAVTELETAMEVVGELTDALGRLEELTDAVEAAAA